MTFMSMSARAAAWTSLSLLALVPRTALADGICTPQPFDIAGFESVIENRLAGVKGYSVTIARPGELVASHSGGVAADGVDAPFPIAMDGATPGDVGSTTKMLSTVALLQYFENDTSASVDEWLDREIVDYFPAAWRDRVFDNSAPARVQDVRFVTFRDILQHRSGLAGDNFITNGIIYQDLIAGVRNYANGNISVIGYMWPYIVDPSVGALIDFAVAGEVPAEDGLYREYTGTYFGEYLQGMMFDPVEISAGLGVDVPYGGWSEHLEPSCNPKQSYAVTPYFRDINWGAAGDEPLVGDMNGDGEDDLVVWRPDPGAWYVRTVAGTTLASGTDYGSAALGDIPRVGDVDGDGDDDYVIWRESTGGWYARTLNGATLASGLVYGVDGDIPLVANVGGNAAEDFVIWRPSTGAWYAKQRNGTTLFSAVSFGTAGDVPHVGDVNGDGTAELVVWRPSTGQWFARDLVSGNTIVSGLSWGHSGDVSLLGDADGNGDDDFMIFRPGTGEWFARDAGGVYFRDAYWGQAEITGSGPATPLVGDFAGDVKDKLTLFLPSNGHWSAAGRRYALGYNNAADQGPGGPAPFTQEPAGCASQGGYWLSSMEYAAWAASLADGEIISLELLDEMFDPTSSTTRGERLGWALVATAPTFIRSTYDVDYLPWHDGAFGSFRAAFIQLPDGYFGFALSNDGDVPGPTAGTLVLRDAIIDAWIEAVDLDCELG